MEQPAEASLREPRTSHPLAQPLTRAELKLASNLALASRMLAMDGHDDLNQGQVSARLPGQQRFLIKSAMRGFGEATPEDMIVAAIDAEEPPDRIAPPELALHQAIYAARPDVNAVVHSHAPFTLIVGATDWALRPISHDGACFQGRTPRFTETSSTVLDIATGRAVACALGDGPAIFLRNHGGVVVGKSLREAAVLAQVLERACRLQVIAESTGASYHVSNDADVRSKREFNFSDTSLRSYWEFCVRQVKRTWKESEDW
jgi:L-fuculose-phosphate aldolase